MRRAIRDFVLLASILLGAASASDAAGTAELLRDINSEERDGGRFTGPLLAAGNRVVFPAFTTGSSNELWGSDGTSLGTELLREIIPGTDGPVLTAVGTVRGIALFLAERDVSHPFGLWRSDGTSEGTFQIAQLGRCSNGSQGVVMGSFLYFTALDGTGCNLWRTDGTAAGTGLVKDFYPSSSVASDPLSSLVAAGGRLFFFLDLDLWISDGTPAGTSFLQTFSERPEDGLPELTPADSRVFFIAPASGGEELWTSDGTLAGTRPVSDFFEPFPFAPPPYESVVTVIDRILYFLADDGTGTDLWQSDGTVKGTRRVTDFVEENPFPRNNEPVAMVARLGNRLIFPAGNDREGWRLWASGGTPQTTKALEGCPGGCPKVGATPLVRIGSRALFAGNLGNGAPGLWVTDGTGSGTRRLSDLCLDCSGFAPFDAPLFPLLGKVFFFVRGSQGVSLWRSDGTPAGTMRLAVLGARPFQSLGPSAFRPVEAGGKIFFAASLGENPSAQLWSSDGTPAGTSLVTFFNETSSSFPSGMVPFGGGALFTACDGERVSVWRSDGSEATTMPVFSSARSSCSVLDPRPVVAGGLAFFPSEAQLWRTDGTSAGTFPVTSDAIGQIGEIAAFGNRVVFLVSAIFPDPPYVETTLWESDGTLAGTRPLVLLPFLPHSLRALGSRIFFLVNVPTHGEQLWVTDGAGAVPVALTAVQNGIAGYEHLEIVQVGASFFARVQHQVWKTDGTAAGTVQVPFSLEPFTGASSFLAFQGSLYFMAGAPQSPTGAALWRSDGTAAGTFVVKPVRPPEFSARLTVLGNRFYFVADDGEHGFELWSSDGTAAGTAMVRDLIPGAASSDPSWLTVANGRLYFSAADVGGGNELWGSDGTADGTRRVQDIAPGAGSSNPRELAAAGNRLFFAANDGIHGEEPWVLPLNGGGCVPSAEVLCLGGRFRVEADWRDFQGNRGAGRAVALTADTGYFWFFDADNVEVILKVLDGRPLNGHHWVFYGALSSVEYSLTVTDTETGAARRYTNISGRLGSVADTEAFGPNGASASGVVTTGPAPEMGEAIVSSRTTEATGICVPGPTRLCLQDGRFAVEARWKAQGQTGTGQAVPLAGGDTGYFWFFDASNVEVVLKVLDGTPLNGKFWVFYGALSNVEYTLTVTDTVTGAVKTYSNPSGRLASVADTGAF